MPLHTRLRSVAAAAAAALALTLAPSAATAATTPVDVTGFTVRDVVFSAPGCKATTAYVKRTVAADAGDYLILSAIMRYGYAIEAAEFDRDYYWDRPVVCDEDGLGVYRIGPSAIFNNAYPDGYDDGTNKAFYVRGQAKASVSASRSGSYVSLLAQATYYSPASAGQRAFNPQDARFQKWTSSGWKTIRTVDFRNGRGWYKLYAPAWGKYRVVLNQTTTTTAATSATASK